MADGVSMSDYTHIKVEIRGQVMRITLNRPEAMNALNVATHQDLSTAFDRYASDDSLRVAVITGAGKAFCAGSDLKEKTESGPRSQTFKGGYAGLIERFDLYKPVIAAVNGHALGGGLEIVMACDLAVAVSGVKFGFPEPRVGLVATGALHRLARHVPLKAAMDIALSSRTFSSERALEYGLINAIVSADQLESEVGRRVEEILAGAPLAVMGTKQMMLKGLGAGSIEAAFAGEYDLVEKAVTGADAREGPRAFAEKRKPNWRGV